jgi:predicted ATPase
MQQVKGSVLKARLAFVADHGGKDAVARVEAELTSEERQALQTLLTMKWYPFELGKRLDDAIVRVLGGGRREFFEKLGEASAETNLTTLHQAFLVAGDPHAFLAKAPQIYALYYETGRREYARTG